MIEMLSRFKLFLKSNEVKSRLRFLEFVDQIVQLIVSRIPFSEFLGLLNFGDVLSQVVEEQSAVLGRKVVTNRFVGVAQITPLHHF